MSKALCTLAGLFMGVLLTLGTVTVIEQYGPNPDACVAQAVRVYPSLAGRELVVGNLGACKRLNDDDLATVRTQLQDFGIAATQNVEAGK